MQTEMTSSAQQDESAVAAVRRGDAERYRELVERHERRVFAVAWSRLGDAGLAEEAAQEAFIRGYRRLWLLGDGAKFAAWITTIARHAAINLGLRHRRELNKRERWALEQPAAASPVTGETTELCTPETLRQTLAELPAAHRECLVLFYLEGKSGAEAAATLGISEAALRVRLHRARAAMRERLEEKLEGSLENLRPAKTLVSTVMAAVLASSSAKAAAAGGIGAAILGTLAKFTPFKWLFAMLAFIPLLLPAVMILPGLVFQRWQRRDEQRNYRDQKGFRASLHRQVNPSFLVVSLFVIGIFLIYFVTASRVFGTKELFLVLGLFMLVGLVFSARGLQIDCSRSAVLPLFSNLVMCAVCLVVAGGWLPVLAVCYASLVSSFLLMFGKNSRSARMDNNIFLRATQGMLPPADATVQRESSNRFDRSCLRAFARFLGERQLATNFRWGINGLTLYMPGVKSPLMTMWNRIFPSVRNKSNFTLGWDGLVAAQCGKIDVAGLEVLRSHSTADLPGLENQVALAVVQAWQNFREGKMVLAERAIGQIPDAEIFVVPPTRTRANRWQRIVFGSLVVVSLILFGISWLFSERLSGLKPISLNEAQVRAFLAMSTTNPNPIIGHEQKSYAYDPSMALFDCLVVPSTNLFSPEGLQGMRNAVAEGNGFDSLRQNKWRASAVFQAPLLRHAMAEGWISWDDLNIHPTDSAVSLRASRYMYQRDKWEDYFLTRCGAWSWVKQQSFEAKRIQLDGLVQLQLLREVNCLDLIPSEKLSQQIASVQVLSATPTTDQPPIHDWRDVRGLFFTPCFPALQDTYYSIAALEILGGLDKIDREACIKGILSRHAGKGYFTSPSSGSYNEYHIDGSARDTIAAFESLRILGALDRVKDLDKWQFRVASYRASKPDANGVRVLTWDEIEAWVCQQRLQEILRERKENPAAPVRSLLEP